MLTHVDLREGRAEACGAGLDGLLDDVGHELHLLLAGDEERVDAALAEDEAADGGVSDLRGKIHDGRALLQVVEELREGLPAPLDPVVQRGPRDVLDSFHQFDQEVVVVRPARRAANTQWMNVRHRRSGRQRNGGTHNVTPQLPKTTDVTPCQHEGLSVGSHPTCAS